MKQIIWKNIVPNISQGSNNQKRSLFLLLSILFSTFSESKIAHKNILEITAKKVCFSPSQETELTSNLVTVTVAIDFAAFFSNENLIILHFDVAKPEQFQWKMQLVLLQVLIIMSIVDSLSANNQTILL